MGTIDLPARTLAAMTAEGKAEYERFLREMESQELALSRAGQLLGSPAQVAGTGGFDKGGLKFYEQFAFDPTATQAMHGAIKPEYQAQIDQVVSSTNTLMSQARAAYLAGDTAKADELYAQAKANPDALLKQSGLSGNAQLMSGMAWETSSPEYQEAMARSMVTGPMAQQVGGLVAEAGALADKQSPTYQGYYRELVDPASAAIAEQQTRAERAITAERQGAERRVRDLGLSRGAARSATAEAATYGRFADETGRARADAASVASQQRSELLAGAAQYMQNFATEFRFNAPQMAQAFLQNEGGVRDAYMNRLAGSQQAILQFASASAGQMVEAWNQILQYKATERGINAQKSMQLTQGLFDLGAALIGGGFTAAGFSMMKPPTTPGAT